MDTSYKLVLLCGAAAGVLTPTGAFGQTTQAPAEAASDASSEPQTQPGSDPASSDSTLDIVVTGTRVIRDGYQAPTPTTVVSSEMLEARAPSTAIDALSLLPAFKRVATSGTANQSVGSSGGQSFVNLRGLGPNRTLVLLNGQRVAPSTADASVDVALLPQGLFERVDVVTGGGSSAWGSDAVAGVVNFILDTKFQGLKGELQGGVSSRGDNLSGKAELNFGTKFADGRGHILGSFEYYDSEGVGYRSRPWSQYQAGVVANPAYAPGNGQSRLLLSPYAYHGNVTWGGVITDTALRGTQFDSNGNSTAFPFCRINQGANAACDGPRDDISYLGYWTAMTTPQTRGTGYLRLSYDVLDNVNVYADYLHGESNTSYSTLPPSTALGIPILIRNDNPFIPSAIQAQLAPLGITSFNLGRTSRDMGNGTIYRNNRVDRFSIGLDATLADTWRLRTYLTQGTSRQANGFNNVPNRSRFAAAVDAVRDPETARIVCRSTLTNPTNGCVPLNLFGEGAPSAQAIDWVMGEYRADLTLKQLAGGLNLSADPFSTWAGPVSVAVGAEYREESANQVVDATSAVRGWAFGNPQPLSGKFNVKEAYIDTVIPLAKEASWADSLELNAAARYASYSTSGGVTTWKLGATYKPINDILLRATRSRDIRAPSILELFTSTLQSTATIVDTSNTTQPTIRVLTQGNPDLTPEVADTTSAGIVYQPSLLRGFSASVDYYKIKIRGAITTLATQDIANRCNQGNQEICALITRDSSGVITTISRPFLNIQQLVTSGVDFEASYRFELSNIGNNLPGSVALRALGSYVHEYVTGTGVTTLDEAGSLVPGMPKWSWDLNAIYTGGPFLVNLSASHVGGGKFSNEYTQPTDIDINHVDGVWYFGATAQYTFKLDEGRSVAVYLNAANILDTPPPYPFGVSGVPVPGGPGGPYDRIGRSFKAGVRFKM